LILREPRLSEAAKAQKAAQVPAPSQLDARFDARLDSVIMRGLDPRPNHRWQDCEQFIEALQDWLSSQGGVPSTEELQQVVRSIYMKDREGFRLEAPPFTEDFTLEPLDEAELETASAQPLTLKPRPPFGLGPISVEVLEEAGGTRLDTPSTRSRSELPIHPAFAPVGPLLTPPLPPGLASSSSQCSRGGWIWWLLTASLVAVFCLWWLRHG
jgi:hypothetical protein